MNKNGWEKLESRVERGPWSAITSIGCIVVPAIVLLLVVATGIGFFGNFFTQGQRVIEKTIDADNMIYNYEWFKQRHEDIGAIDQKIELSVVAVQSFIEAAGDRKDWHREDREEHARLSTVRLGLEQQRADLAAEYNARSRMVNRSVFKTGDSELPEEIEL